MKWTVISFLLVIEFLSSTALAPRTYRRFITTNNNNNNNNNNNLNTIYTNVVTVLPTVTCVMNGHTYSFGQTVTDADACTVCACAQSGMVCNSMACPLHVPTTYEHHKCQYGGAMHPFGSTFDHTDGCNKCVCGINSIQCTDAPSCKTQGDCIYAGVGHSLGDVFPSSDGCNKCQCTILGVVCTQNTCTTTTQAPYTCEWFGHFYHDGDIMPVDGCHTCTCQTGHASCTATMNCPTSG